MTDAVPMIFRLFDAATDGNLCWEELHTGANEVEVVDGRFSILLGSITPVNDPSCLAEDAYLELDIDGDPLTPRQLLADTLVSNGSVLGKTDVGQDLSFETEPNRTTIFGPQEGFLYLVANPTRLTSQYYWFRGGWILLTSLESELPGSVRVTLAKDNNLGNSPTFDIFRVQNDGVFQELMQVDENGNMSVNGHLSLNRHYPQ